MTHKKILIIATGGTIESFYGKEGDGGKGAPVNVPSESSTIMHDAVECAGLADICDVYEACVRDSKDVDQTILNRIALYISEHASEYDGIVITHGTDTMPRNARTLEDMLETIGAPPMPIVFTGSMIPLRTENKSWRKETDGWTNLKNSVSEAQRKKPGVYICMDNFTLKASTVDKNVVANPDNTVSEGRFVDYDPERWQPLTPITRVF